MVSHLEADPNCFLANKFLKICSSLGENFSFSEWTVLVNDAFNELNVSKEERVKVIENDGSVVQGMDQVLKKLHKNHDIIIITGSDYETVRLFMLKHNILQFVKNIYGRPGHFTNDGETQIRKYSSNMGNSMPIMQRWVWLC